MGLGNLNRVEYFFQNVIRRDVFRLGFVCQEDAVTQNVVDGELAAARIQTSTAVGSAVGTLGESVVFFKKGNIATAGVISARL